jgi:hypothetical protein
MELSDLIIPIPDHSPYSAVRVIPVENTIELNIESPFKGISGFDVPITFSLRSAKAVGYKYRCDLSSSLVNVSSGPKCTKQQRSTNMEKNTKLQTIQKIK